MALIEDAARLGVETIWEVDDLIFDVTRYGQNANLANLKRPLRRNLLKGALLYRRGMLAADRTIATTTTTVNADGGGDRQAERRGRERA